MRWGANGKAENREGLKTFPYKGSTLRTKLPF
jgi:hypothetical protein